MRCPSTLAIAVGALVLALAVVAPQVEFAHACPPPPVDPDPYVLWYALNAKPYNNGCGCPSPWVASWCPYTFNPAPKANNPSPLGIHDNITRFWNFADGADATFYVNVPGGQPNLAQPIPIPGLAPTVTYTWQNFKDDINQTFAKYTSVPTALVTANFGGLTDTDWNNTTGFPGNFIFNIGTAPQLIWPLSCGGPTGDGRNEIIFLTTRTIGATNGVASMLFDPATGDITECDLIFEMTLPGSQWPTLGPAYSTAYAHEVGHYFGLDHTNLYTGLNVGNGGTASPAPPNPLPLAGYETSNMQFTAWSQIPAMAAAHCALPLNHVSQPLHPDEVAALSEVYPVHYPGELPNKWPLINTTGRIQGTVVQRQGSLNVPCFGRNVYVKQHSSCGPSFPTVTVHGSE